MSETNINEACAGKLTDQPKPTKTETVFLIVTATDERDGSLLWARSIVFNPRRGRDIELSFKESFENGTSALRRFNPATGFSKIISVRSPEKRVPSKKVPSLTNVVIKVITKKEVKAAAMKEANSSNEKSAGSKVKNVKSHKSGTKQTAPKAKKPAK